MLYHAVQAGVFTLKDGLLEILKCMRRAGMLFMQLLLLTLFTI